MAKKEEVVEEVKEVKAPKFKVKAPKFNCTNCEDSGLECLECGAGR